MNKFVTKALYTPELQTLLNAGLKVVSTSRQFENGTIALAGKVKTRANGKVRKQPVSYKVTATGAVLSNEFVARQVFADSELKQYRAGLKAATELLAKRQAA